MLIVLCILLSMYVGLFLYHAYVSTLPRVRIPPWSPLSPPPDEPQPVVQCQLDSDCSPHSVCLGNTCVPKLLRGGQCDPLTGDWVPFPYRNATFAVCSCLKEEIFSQKMFGGNCNVPVACGSHGTYDLALLACRCDEGYQPVGLACHKVPVLENAPYPCAADEIDVSQIDPARDGFHAEYVARLRGSARCVKRPCTFDALSGRPLQHGRYEADWGCVCDPTFGLFGVRLEGRNKKYLIPESGFDACVSLFTEDPPHPSSVELITYFYLGEREPVSLILFDVSEERLLPLLKGRNGKFTVRQNAWRHDYAQHLFRQNAPLRARTRKASHVPLFRTIVVDEYAFVEPFRPPPCGTIDQMAQLPHLDRPLAYALLYQYPVCRVDDHDARVDPLFRGRVILNPHLFTLAAFPELVRYNAFVLHYDVDLRRWTLDLYYEYDVDRFRNMDTNVPRT